MFGQREFDEFSGFVDGFYIDDLHLLGQIIFRRQAQ